MMRTKTKRMGNGRKSMWLAVIVAASWCGVVEADDRTPSQLLEKGIYTEETVGDLDKAIEIYQQAIDSAKANRTILAQAQQDPESHAFVVRYGAESRMDGADKKIQRIESKPQRFC